MSLKTRPGFPVYFARHGETLLNTQRRWQGSRNDSPLTEAGERHARDTGTILKDLISLRDPPRFVASPLPRARRTMEIVLETIGLPQDSYSTDARLVELDTGEWSGACVDDVRASDPRFAARQRDRWNVPCPGGESYAAAARRAASWLESLTAETFAVSHGALGRILRGLYAGLAPDEMIALEEPQGCVFRLHGGTVTRFDLRADTEGR
jgi:probable phosphoglycerate mutase